MPNTRISPFALGLAALTAAAFAPGAAHAQTVNEVITSCYVPASGSVYRIKTPGGPTTCQSPKHVEFTWNSQGIQGEKGDKGETGAQGPQGLKGDKGDTGATGPQGVQGETGATGAAGASDALTTARQRLAAVVGDATVTELAPIEIALGQVEQVLRSTP